MLVPVSGPARLGYLTPMERGEAAATGISLMSPEELEVEGARRDGEVELWTAVLTRAFEIAGVESGTVALAGRTRAGNVVAACKNLERGGWSFESGHELVSSVRKTKEASELSEVRRVAAGTTEAMRAVAADLARAEPGDNGLILEGRPLTAGRLRRRIAEVLAGYELDQPHGNIVSQGAEAAVPHTQGGSEVPLAPGQSIVVDLYPRGHLFADCTRTFCVGRPTEALVEAHAAVQAALEVAHSSVRTGVSGADLQASVCDLLESRGYPTARSSPGTDKGYVHGLGHGVGWELHEYPTFRNGDSEQGRLAVGDVFTLEPGLYDERQGFGVRLEDLCTLTSEGLENLTPLPYELEPGAWA